MPEAVIVALIAGSAAVIGSLTGYLVARLRIPVERQKVQIEGVSAEAAAEFQRAQASSEVLQMLRDDYRRVRDLYEQALTDMAMLRSEVNSYRQQLAQFEAIVLTLPDEYRGRFAEVLASKGSRPKGGNGGSAT